MSVRNMMCYTQGKPVKEFGMGDIKSLFCKQATNDKSVEKEDEASQTPKKGQSERSKQRSDKEACQGERGN